MSQQELKNYMAENRLTVVRAAEILHVSRGGLYKWLSGQRKTPAWVVPTLTDLLRARAAAGRILRLGSAWEMR